MLFYAGMNGEKSMISIKKRIFNNYFLNLNISKTMAYTELKFGVYILHTHPEGTVSQIFHLRLSFHFMPKIGKLFAKFLKLIF